MQHKSGNALNWHDRCAPPTKRALPRICYVSFPSTCLLRLFVAWHISDFVYTPLEMETETWNDHTSPTCDLCNAEGIQDEQHVFFYRTHPKILICFHPQVPTVCVLFWARQTWIRRKHHFYRYWSYTCMAWLSLFLPANTVRWPWHPLSWVAELLSAGVRRQENPAVYWRGGGN